MLGLTRLRRRFRRFRYNNQARFPRLFVIFDMAKLPLQIMLVALPLWIAVGFYDDHFSYQANNDRLKKSRSMVVEKPPTSIIDESVVTVTIDRQAGEALSSMIDPVAEVINSPAKETIPKDASTLNNSAQLPGKPDKVAELDDVVTRIAGPSSIHNEKLNTTSLRDASWLVAQSNASFVIQFESSRNVELMRQQARKLSTSEELALYPYKFSQDGDLVYGLSYGLYDSLSEARAANASLPEEMRRFGSWIRQVGLLKKQMESIDSTLAQR